MNKTRDQIEAEFYGSLKTNKFMEMEYDGLYLDIFLLYCRDLESNTQQSHMSDL